MSIGEPAAALDLRGLLATLQAHEVDYTVIGGVAVLHILRDVPGAPAYADLRARALVIDLDGIRVPIAGLDDLISMKRASGRPSDERDIAALLAVAPGE